MTSPHGDTPGTFGTPHFEVRWQARRANFLESCHAALLGPRAPRGLDPASSYFRLRLQPRRIPSAVIAGSLVCHVILLGLLIPLDRLAQPAPPLTLPQIEITWYGPATDVAPATARKPSRPKSSRRAARKPKAPLLARAYNAKTTVVFQPHRPTNTRQVLIEPEAPPTPPIFLPSIPNIITWAAAPPLQPPIEVNPNALVARRRTKGSLARAMAPQIAAETPPAAPLDIAPISRATPQPPLPLAPGAVRAARAKTTPKSVAAPAVAFAANRLVALSIAPGKALPPPGNASAPMSIGPRVGKTTSSAAPDIAMNAGPAVAGAPEAGGGLPGPAGLLILHEGAGPAPPPAPRAPSPLPRIAALSPLALRPPDSLPAHRNAAGGSGIAPHDLAHEILGMRPIHTLLMNMPNLTSATGSWVLQFARVPGVKIPLGGSIVPPLPVRKVDPEYPPDLIQEEVEGEVVLYAVIGKDGTVSHIRVVKGLDPVLDRNAEAAFAKWKFRPALADNNPIDLEVLVHIPFHYQSPQ
ncbi:MAG TPA: TonB family protein [Candidatus Dormibacteraeota bacterium]|nr:TonB family protein [Candidatus Dormibacteraeota bacterium]